VKVLRFSWIRSHLALPTYDLGPPSPIISHLVIEGIQRNSINTIPIAVLL
jgi:hypothetical protein